MPRGDTQMLPTQGSTPPTLRHPVSISSTITRIGTASLFSATSGYLAAAVGVLGFALWWFLSAYYEQKGYDRYGEEHRAMVAAANKDRAEAAILHGAAQTARGLVVEDIIKRGDVQLALDLPKIRANADRHDQPTPANPAAPRQPRYLPADSVRILTDAEAQLNRALRDVDSTR